MAVVVVVVEVLVLVLVLVLALLPALLLVLLLVVGVFTAWRDAHTLSNRYFANSVASCVIVTVMVKESYGHGVK
jgi:hypothetical protein